MESIFLMSKSNIIFDPIQTVDAVRQVFELIHSIALQANVSLKPVPSEPTSCCGRGCEGCVWISFVNAAEHWRQGAILTLNTLRANRLSL
jgi:Oxidoreductase-like protein, N-terminal